ncbi:triose-phosphate isomerase [Candidatus Falkowbacteria bacterium]|jgi:triosephosphate isomerase (TIM)|nr:triose-phosphate isomerase [Candidatus Falkowbacteria bacterium]MBT4433418.1 triose-phosphate isomerase [Candidatus Falkowbacteria bacterium]
MKKTYIIANWKMQLGVEKSVELFSQIVSNFPEKNKTEVVVCPAYTSLQKVNELNKDKIVKLGAQDVFWEESGAYTGEISCEMLKEIGCEYVIIGHSDRRKYFKEDDEIIHHKAKTALKCSLVPIVCVGETFQERQEGRKDYAIISQVTKALSGIKPVGNNKIIIAYEPVWVIGSGQAINAEEAEHMHQVIRQTIVDLFGVSIMEKNFKIIYGGSISKKIVKTFLIQPNIDGVLVGGASLKPQEFLGIIEEAISIK